MQNTSTSRSTDFRRQKTITSKTPLTLYGRGFCASDRTPTTTGSPAGPQSNQNVWVLPPISRNDCPPQNFKIWRCRHRYLLRNGLYTCEASLITWDSARSCSRETRTNDMKKWSCLCVVQEIRNAAFSKSGQPFRFSIDRLYYYGSGTKFGASWPFDHARSIAVCTFPRHFLGLAWLWTTVFFFSLLERHRRCLVMCSYTVGTGKSPDLSDFHPCRSRQSLAITPGQLSWPELRKGDIQEEKSISCWRTMLV